MRPQITRLTDTAIKRLRPEIGDDGRSKPVELADPATEGLAIVAGSRSKVWYLRYKQDGQRRRAKLGVWPGMSTADARKHALELKERVERGRHVDQKALPVSELLERYFEHFRARGNRTAYEVERMLRKHLEPVVGDLPANHVTRQHILSIFRSIKAPRAANQFVAISRAFFSYLVAEGILDADGNPAAKISSRTLHKENARERVLSDIELTQLWLASETHQGFPPYFGALVRLIILTGCRRGEIAALTTAMMDRDEEGGRWVTLPAEIMKAGQQHRLWLTETALKELPKPRKDGRYFTPGVSWSRCMKNIFDVAGIEDGRLHDLRRSMAVGMQRLGVAPHVIERTLAHQPRGIVAVYQRFMYDEEAKAAWELWARHVEGITERIGAT